MPFRWSHGRPDYKSGGGGTIHLQETSKDKKKNMHLETHTHTDEPMSKGAQSHDERCGLENGNS